MFDAGVVNYCVPGGEAYQKALELAREINEKVSFFSLSVLCASLGLVEHLRGTRKKRQICGHPQFVRK
jgi:enoyl-CoA hydratase/carnithine racemase